MNGIKSPADFEEYQKTHLYANSYPSGHSSGMFCCSMLLMELLPNKADKILRAANQYAVNRTIARYHWTSDTINGRVLGSATNAICHAASDYYKMLKTIEKELSC
jgi:membrane-associated phospholipid phosphatase